MAPRFGPLRTPAPKTPDQMSLVEKRAQLIKLRFMSLERGRIVLGWEEKWPTVKNVRMFQDEQAYLSATSAPQSPTTLPTRADVELPSQVSVHLLWAISGLIAIGSLLNTAIYGSDFFTFIAKLTLRILRLELQKHSKRVKPQQDTETVQAATSGEVLAQKDAVTTETTPIAIASFPFPVTICKHVTSFSLFSQLPTELRLHIWELALSSPAFIKVQYCSDFYEPTFVNVPCRNSIRLVCRESAKVVATKEQWILRREITSKLRLFQSQGNFSYPDLTFSQKQKAIFHNREPSKPWPRAEIPFIPSRDTIFLRSLDGIKSNPALYYMPKGRPLLEMRQVQHLALPLDATSLASFQQYEPFLYLMRTLKSLTFVVGSSEKSWMTSGSVELRPLHQWFADGRNKWLDFSGKREAILRASQVQSWLLNANAELEPEDTPGVISGPSGWRDMMISVRVVAWKRN